MKFLADENFPKLVVKTIRSLGHSVKTIQQKNLQGASDRAVSTIALREKRIVLTFDKDLLENHTQNVRIVVFHFPKVPSIEIVPFVEEFLEDLSNTDTRNKIFIFSKRGLEIVK